VTARLLLYCPCCNKSVLDLKSFKCYQVILTSLDFFAIAVAEAFTKFFS